jgi:tRNA 5-methylaminomethyl-2-thiouridine biosynthesis bifunctional protein
MSPGEGHWRGAPAARLGWAEDGSPRSLDFDDVYYSSGGPAESHHVFLQGNGLPGGWLQRDVPFTIIETGFGTGLNFLTTWDTWRRCGNDAPRLHYVSIEAFPLRREDLQRALSAWPELAPLSDELAGDYPPPLPGQHRLLFDRGRVCLDLYIDDVHGALATMAEDSKLVADAWYLDGFAPARNPEMWTDTLFTAMAGLSRRGTRLATFTSAGHVRRGLQAAGFTVTKVAGHGSKREMLQGSFEAVPPPRRARSTPWHIATTPDTTARSALVLGAGLAGATSAAALARRGWNVQVLECAGVAGAASGNSQGVLYTRISHRPSELNSFALASYTFALRLYRRLLDSGQLRVGVDGELCGALHLGSEPEPLLRETLASLPELAQWVEAPRAAELSGLAGCPAGLYYPDAGWMSPPAVCRALLDHPLISLSEQCGEVALHRDGDAWTATGVEGELARAAVAVIACGTASTGVAGLDWLPLRPIRGQVTELPTCDSLSALRTVICHEGYIAPARDGQHCIGATFDLGDEEADTRPDDHLRNLAQLREALPVLAAALPDTADTGRVGFRCASPDYLPLAGPVADRPAFIEDYAALRRNARRTIERTGSYQPGLFVSSGHGSRGLTSTPLAAELLASQVCGEPTPLPATLCRALSPSRFLIRDLARGRL